MPVGQPDLSPLSRSFSKQLPVAALLSADVGLCWEQLCSRPSGWV